MAKRSEPEPLARSVGPAAETSDPRLARAVRSIAVISRGFEQVCRETGVSLPQYRLLLFLRHGPRRAGELAARVAIKRPSLTALVAGLEKEGRLRRATDEHDGRGVRIEITRRGKSALEEVEGRLAELIAELCDKGDRDALLAALDDLAQIVEQEFDRRVREQEPEAGSS